MRLHRWISTGLALGALMLSPDLVVAQSAPVAASHLPKECVDAGLNTQKECDAFLKKTGPKSQPAPAATEAKPNSGTAAPSKPIPVAPTAGQPSTSQSAAASAPVVNKVAPVDLKPQAVQLPRDCIAAGLTSAAECDALHAKAGKMPQKPVAPAPIQNVSPTNISKPATTTSNPKTPVAPAPTDVTGAAPASTPAANNANAKPLLVHLAPDCVAAGLKTQAECDALHANINVKPAKTVPLQPGVKAPVTSIAPAAQPSVVAQPAAPATRTAGQPAKGTPLAKDCLDAGLKTQAECDAMHAINAQNGKAKAPGAQTAAPAAASAAQPVEAIPVLPKGVTKDQVAPLLDSAKLDKLGKGKAPSQPSAATPAAANAPPPSNDKATQAAIQPANIVPIDQQKGQQIDPNAKAAQVQLPQNVTVVNQAAVNGTAPNNKPGSQPDGGAPSHAGTGVAGNGPTSDQPVNPIGLGIGLVLQIGNQLIINSPGRDQYRIADSNHDRTDYERLPQDRYRETITRPDGTRIVTIYNRNGDILRRSRFDQNGHEVVLAYFDDSRDQGFQQWRDPGDDLPPLRLSIPVNEYVLDAGRADEGQVQQFFSQPPVEQVQRLYSINEVKRSARLRDMVRRLEIGDLTFDTGAATLAQDQVGALSNVADAMLAMLQQNPAETFLIEGHTDAVGSDVSNLQLSDARAATVANILTDYYHIPPENLATQGYGAQFLKVQTTGPERLNRRVVIRRITPLVTVASGNQ